MLGRAQRLLKRLGGFATSFIFSTAVALFSIPFIVDGLGPTVWSGLAVVQSISALVGMIVAYGWGTVGAATVANEPSETRRQLFVDSLIGRGYLFLALAPMMFFFLLAFGGENAILWACASIAYLLPSLGASWYFVGEAKPWRLLLYSGLPQGFGTIAGVIIIHFSANPYIFVACQFAFSLAAIAMSAHVVMARSGGQQPLTFVFDIRCVSRKLNAQKHGVITSAMGTINNSLPLIVVSVIAPNFVAVYAMADRLFRFAIAAVGPLLQVVQGWIPEAGPKIARSRIALLTRVSPAMGILGGVGIALLFPWMSHIFSNGKIDVGYELSIPFGAVFASVAVAQVIGLACLIPLGKGALLAKSTAAGTAVNLPLMFLLTYAFEGQGTAWGIAAAEAVIAVWQLRVALQVSSARLASCHR